MSDPDYKHVDSAKDVGTVPVAGGVVVGPEHSANRSDVLAAEEGLIGLDTTVSGELARSDAHMKPAVEGLPCLALVDIVTLWDRLKEVEHRTAFLTCMFESLVQLLEVFSVEQSGAAPINCASISDLKDLATSSGRLSE